ncbi:hypothetical protein FB451DRAFT_1167953 [Mycena latifolia]|nr:hypothetical protein FB451DRAFT_1167953 [Mycena latifolia]
MENDPLRPPDPPHPHSTSQDDRRAALRALELAAVEHAAQVARLGVQLQHAREDTERARAEATQAQGQLNEARAETNEARADTVEAQRQLKEAPIQLAELRTKYERAKGWWAVNHKRRNEESAGDAGGEEQDSGPSRSPEQACTSQVVMSMQRIKLDSTAAPVSVPVSRSASSTSAAPRPRTPGPTANARPATDKPRLRVGPTIKRPAPPASVAFQGAFRSDGGGGRFTGSRCTGHVHVGTHLHARADIDADIEVVDDADAAIPVPAVPAGLPPYAGRVPAAAPESASAHWAARKPPRGNTGARRSPNFTNASGNPNGQRSASWNGSWRSPNPTTGASWSPNPQWSPNPNTGASWSPNPSDTRWPTRR